MAAPPEVVEGEGDKPEAPPAAPAPAVIKIEQPLEAKEFDQFLDTFMSKAGVSDRRKAAILATRALQNIGLDPTTHLEEAVKGTQFLTSVLSTLPDAGEVTRATKDVVMAQSVSRVGERFMEGPAPEERMERLMQMMMPYMMVMRMMSGGDMGGGTVGTKSPEVEALKAEFTRLRDDIKGDKVNRQFDERFGKLDQKLDKLSERKPTEEGEGAIAKKFDELKTALTGSKESEVATKIDNLTKALTEKDRTSELDKMSAKVDEMKAGLESKISGLNTSMNEGEPKGDVMSRATDLINSMGNFYTGFGNAAKTMGFEPRDEKMSGDLRKDMLSLGKKALDVVEKSVKYRGGEKPPRQEVQQLPQLPQRVEIPIPTKAPKPATIPGGKGAAPAATVEVKPAEKPPAQPAEAPPGPAQPGLPSETVAPLDPTIPDDIPDKMGLWKPPAEKPPGAPKAAPPKAPPAEAPKKPPEQPQEGST